MTRTTRLAAAIALGISFSCVIQAGVVFDQPLFNDTDRGAFAWHDGQELADQFTLTNSVTIGGVSWYGTFWQTDLGSGVTQYPFVIRFFESAPASHYGQSLGNSTTAAGVPIYEAVVLANVNPSGIAFNGTATNDGDSIDRVTYKFSVDNLNGPMLAANHEYWVSILVEGTTLWRWGNSTTPSDYSAYRFVYLNETEWAGFSNNPGNGSLGTQRSDLAFALYAEEVPEPSTITCVVSAALAAAIFRRKLKASEERRRTRVGS